MSRSFVPGVVLALAGVVLMAAPVFAGPQEDVASANKLVGAALVAAQSGDLVTALRQYRSYENQWFDIEDGVREQSREAYRLIERHMVDANAALSANPAKKDEAIRALQALDAEQRLFIAGQPANAGSQSQVAPAG